MHYQTLTDHWQIRPLKEFHQGIYPRDERGWQPAQVPGHWQQLPGLEQHHGKVVYRCRFAQPHPVAGQRQWLRLAGVFYHSHPYLNGVALGPHEGYFIPQEVEVSGLLQAENTLLVEVDCPEERNKLGKKMLTGVFSHWDCLDPQANPGGIWLPVELHRSGAVRLSHARLLTSACDERFAQVRFELELNAAQAGPVTLRVRFVPRTFVGATQEFTLQRELTAGPQCLGGLIKLREPRLWWSHDLGRPDLYDVAIEIVVNEEISDIFNVVFGVRTFELRQWIAYLNGQRFLVKGNNYPPGDMRIATMTRERYVQDLALARDCHFNMLRIHAHIEHPEFYAAANEAGILLWQDFPLQWVYEHSILPEGLRQVRAMVRLLGSHPALVVWCMHNEAFLLEDTADESWFARLRTQISALGFSWNRDVLDTQMKALAEQEDSTRPVVRSSGEFHLPYVREGTDCHAYFGWYRSYGTLEDAEMMQRRFPGNLSFITEFGTQSFPNLESSRRFMPDPLDEAAIRRLETRHNFQGEIMANWLPWREANSLAEVVDMSQDYQIFINRYYVDRLRDRKYRPTGGIIAFLFLDPYPAVLWSIVDYWRVPKRSYYALRLAFSPQYVYCIFFPRTYAVGEAIHLPISVINDARRTILGAQLEAQLRDPTGRLIAEVRQRLDLPADCAPIVADRLRLTPSMPGRYALQLHLAGVEHEVRQVYEIAVGPSR